MKITKKAKQFQTLRSESEHSKTMKYSTNLSLSLKQQHHSTSQPSQPHKQHFNHTQLNILYSTIQQ